MDTSLSLILPPAMPSTLPPSDDAPTVRPAPMSLAVYARSTTRRPSTPMQRPSMRRLALIRLAIITEAHARWNDCMAQQVEADTTILAQRYLARFGFHYTSNSNYTRAS